MAKDYAKHRPRKKKKTDLHPKLWLLTILLIVLFITGLIALNHNKTKVKVVKVKTPINQPKPATTTKTQPQFDFYTILPKEQVNVAKLSPPANSNIQYVLQVAAVQNSDDADHLQAELSLLGFDVYVQKAKIDNEVWNRVNVGPYSSSKAAETDQKRLAENNIKSIVKKINLH